MLHRYGGGVKGGCLDPAEDLPFWGMASRFAVATGNWNDNNTWVPVLARRFFHATAARAARLQRAALAFHRTLPAPYSGEC